MRNFLPLIMILSMLAIHPAFGQGVELTNIEKLNTDHLEFNPVPWGDGIIFTSSKSNRFLKCPSDNPGEYTDLVYARRNPDGTFGERVALRGKINGKYNDGAATFNTLGNKMIFTRNDMKGRNQYDVIDLKLYSADLVDSQWVNIEPLPFNGDEWSTCHPTLSPDGTLLIFSSNRPGSTGGSMDLWASRYENGQWSEPFNLGPSVNTDSTEIFPYLDENGILYFASNGHGGMGGLDLFAATQDANGAWSLAGNLGQPFNTPADDVSFVPLNNGTEGYWASAGGPNGKGLDDIYYFKRVPQPVEAIVLVVDSLTGQPIGQATVMLETTGFETTLDNLYKANVEPQNNLTDAQGLSKFSVLPGATHRLLVEKEGYESVERNPTTANLTSQPQYVVKLRRKVYMAKLTGIVAELNTKDRIPLANVKLRNKTTGETTELITDGNGQFTTEINCDHQYEVIASKDGYQTSEVTPVTLDEEACKKKGEASVTVYLNKPLIVYFRPIFFDFDKYNIRKPDAAATLDTIAQILQKYPTLRVHLTGNCDARGPTPYNDRLGLNRAESAKRYLVQKGVAANRIETESLGERKPINRCTDGVYCTETEHQANRRVDVIPLEHQEKGVEFRTMEVRIISQTNPDR
ncbi:MAG: hypothetical protein KatS3mg029_0247 [Saprospiraceae bacterium]|nr:MAG: hypothetical protein KatS3mg029_0247 [Saprospiraceae bacterium]